MEQIHKREEKLKASEHVNKKKKPGLKREAPEQSNVDPKKSKFTEGFPLDFYHAL